MIIFNPVYTLLYFLSLGLDILAFFLLVRLIVLWRKPPLLTSLDKMADPLIEMVTTTTGNMLQSKTRIILSEKGVVALSLVIAMLAKGVLVLIWNTFIAS